MTGYSPKSLKEKLGLKPTISAVFLNIPEGYESLLNYPLTTELKQEVDFIQYFTRSYAQLLKDFPQLKQALKLSGMLWISWPKPSCSFASTDLTENTVRAIGLAQGLVDVKVVAINEEWSGLKFVYRLRDRKP